MARKVPHTVITIKEKDPNVCRNELNWFAANKCVKISVPVIVFCRLLAQGSFFCVKIVFFCFQLQRLGHKMASGTKRKEATNTNGSLPAPSQIKTNQQQQIDRQRKEKEREERESLVLWKQPLKTVEYFSKEVFILLSIWCKKLFTHKKLVLFCCALVLLTYLLINSHGPHQQYVQNVYKQLVWCLYWIGLGKPSTRSRKIVVHFFRFIGVLSSVGLGTGLHTFLLYLGPHIAQVTMAAYECGSLNFPQPPYPDE